MLLLLCMIENQAQQDKFKAIFYQYSKLMFQIAHAILKDQHDAEDAVQITLIKLAENLDKIEAIHQDKTKAYLIVMVRNAAYRIYKKRKNILLLPFEVMDENLNDLDISIDEHVLRLEEAKELAEKLEKIQPAYADILTLRYVLEYSPAEIATLLELTVNNVNIRIHRARAALKALLEEGGASDVKANS